MKKKSFIGIALSLCLSIVVLVVIRSLSYVTDYPEGSLVEPMVYTFDPETILASLDKGEMNAFHYIRLEPEEWPLLRKPGSISWNQDDYIKVADALHQVIWKESFSMYSWRLINADFRIDQCQDIYGKIDSASLTFYQWRGDYNAVHGFWIKPLYGVITAGNEYSSSTGWDAKWESLDFENLKINSAEAALQVAEEKGGKKARLEENNKCRISIFLSPYVLDHNILSRPFARSDWGWKVDYLQVEANKDPLFSITIDPYTGKYEILQGQDYK